MWASCRACSRTVEGKHGMLPSLPLRWATPNRLPSDRGGAANDDSAVETATRQPAALAATHQKQSRSYAVQLLLRFLLSLTGCRSLPPHDRGLGVLQRRIRWCRRSRNGCFKASTIRVTLKRFRVTLPQLPTRLLPHRSVAPSGSVAELRARLPD